MLQNHQKARKRFKMNNPKASKLLKNPASPKTPSLAALSLILVIILQKFVSSAETTTNSHEEFYKHAMEAYTQLNKSITLTISQKILNQRHFKTMWYVDYIEARATPTKHSGVFDPLLRLTTVMQRGIYFKNFSKTWREINPISEENLEMDALFELPPSNNITAAFIERNSSIVAVAYKNLTVEVIDLQKVRKNPNKTSEVRYLFPSVKINSEYGFGVEDDHEILAIAHIPSTELIVFSSNRFEILKTNQRTGEIVSRNAKPLEKVGLIGSPCLSHRTERDPYNEISIKTAKISQKNLEVGFQTLMVLTGAQDPMNAVLDWTTMKAVSFFSMHLLRKSLARRGDNIVKSIAYYGGVPQGNFYTITTVGVSPLVFLYSGIYRSVMKELNFGVRSRAKVASWVFATLYISVYFPEPEGVDGSPIIKVFKLEAFGMPAQSNPLLDLIAFQRVEDFEMVHQYLQLGRIEQKDQPMFYLEKFYELDSLYLVVYNSSNSVKVQPPPLYWDHCAARPKGFEARTEVYMLYGRYMYCPLVDESGESENFGDSPQVGGEGSTAGNSGGSGGNGSSGNHSGGQGSDGGSGGGNGGGTPGDGYGGNHGGGGGGSQGGPGPGYRIVAEPIKQPPGEAHQFGTRQGRFSGQCDLGLQQIVLKTQFSTEKNRTISTCTNLVCSNRRFIAYYNDPVFTNHFDKRVTDCNIGFSINANSAMFANRNGCRPKFNLNSFGICHYCYSKTSDCLLFEKDFALFDQNTFDYLNYNYKAIDTVIFSKGYKATRGSSDIARSFRELFDDRGTDHLPSLSTVENLVTRKYQKTFLHQKCFDLQFLGNNRGYTVSTKAEYTMKQVSRYSTKLVEELSTKYNGTLQSVVCVKQCEIGWFYDQTSLSCRKCNLGCGVCTSLSNCTRCVPGYNPVKKSSFHQDMRLKYPVGFCRPGCQPGFYPERFKGTCRECPKDCKVCRDKIKQEKFESLSVGVTSEIYCIQCREKNEAGDVLYSNISTGECVTGCSGFGMFTKNVTVSSASSDQNASYLACGRCHGETCESCNQDHREGACTTCLGGYVLEQDGSCLRYWRTEQGILMISTLIFGTLFVFSFLVLVCLYLAVEKAPQPGHTPVIKRKKFGENRVNLEVRNSDRRLGGGSPGKQAEVGLRRPSSLFESGLPVGEQALMIPE